VLSRCLQELQPLLLDIVRHLIGQRAAGVPGRRL
jgi:hypothetical protein